MKKQVVFIFAVIFSMLSLYSTAAEWQWSIALPHTINKETNQNAIAYLWIPPNCKHVKGLIIGQHNMLEEGILEHKAFRKNLEKLGLAEIWITPVVDFVYHPSSNQVFQQLLDSLALKSGYDELASAPIIPIGHSAAASYPWNFAAVNPNRTLAVLSIHGDAPQSDKTGSGKPNPDWGNRNIDGIPALFVMGEYEWREARLDPLLRYQSAHPKSTIAILCDAGHGHFDFSDELVDFLNMFITKCVKFRLTKTARDNAVGSLKKLIPQDGWLVDKWRDNVNPSAPSAPYAVYKGNRQEAGWAFDKEMAEMTESYYAAARGKIPRKIVYMQNGIPLDSANVVGFKPQFTPLADGITFNLKAQNVDGKNFGRIGKAEIFIKRICGPVLKINDTTFRISFDKVGLNNLKRSNVIWFMATQKGDGRYKSAVQQAEMRIPIAKLNGLEQKLFFMQNQQIPYRQSKLTLLARSSAGLPVNYYVKFGPGYVRGNKLLISALPPKSKYPIEISVVAWQYGLDNDGLAIKSAVPVERTFFLQKQ